MKSKLGSLKSVDLRKVWGHEALDFTRWLAQEENIAILCEELEIDIENIKPEESAGRYSVDILADEVDTGRKVIIENQLESTDHKHLGQLLTYASAHDASIIIWIVKDYTEEHKQAIDWFNRHMPTEISFYLVQVALWQIGESEPAPKFSIVSEPNRWARTLKSAATQERGGTSDLRLIQQRFWQAFKDHVNSGGNKLGLNLGKTPRPQHWYEMSFGTSKGHISFTVNSRQKQIGCELYIHRDEEIYRKIEADKNLVMNALGNDVVFMDLPDRAAFRIVKFLPGDPVDETRWPEYFDWLNDQGSKFMKFFKKYF